MAGERPPRRGPDGPVGPAIIIAGCTLAIIVAVVAVVHWW
jgi:hypothetical protein